MGTLTGDEEIKEIRRQLALLVRALETLPIQCKEAGGHPSGICVDTYLTEKELIFQMDLPGIDVNNLKVTVSRENLAVEGNRRRPPTDGEKSFLLAERPFGPFKRVLNLPTTVDTSRVEATLTNGMLIITMPRMTERRGQRHEVQVLLPDQQGGKS